MSPFLTQMDKSERGTLMITSNTMLVGHDVNDNNASVKMIQSTVGQDGVRCRIRVSAETPADNVKVATITKVIILGSLFYSH